MVCVAFSLNGLLFVLTASYTDDSSDEEDNHSPREHHQVGIMCYSLVDFYQYHLIIVITLTLNVAINYYSVLLLFLTLLYILRNYISIISYYFNITYFGDMRIALSVSWNFVVSVPKTIFIFEVAS